MGNLKDLYFNDKDFADYVNKYIRAKGICIDDALEHWNVKAYAEYLEEKVEQQKC